MKKFLLVGVVGLSALVGGCASVMEEPRQAYPDQTPVDVAYYGDSDMAVKKGTGRSGTSPRGQAGANLR